MTQSRGNWISLQEGVFNTITISTNPQPFPGSGRSFYIVRKTPNNNPSSIDRELSQARRNVAIWRILNPNIPVRLNDDNTWDVPYLAGTIPSDYEIAEKLIDIYRTTQHLVLNGCSPNKFIKTSDGQIVCTSTTLALHRNDPIAQNYFYSVICKYGRFIEDDYGMYDDYYRNYIAAGRTKSVTILLDLIPHFYQTLVHLDQMDFILRVTPIQNDTHNIVASPFEITHRSTTHDLFLKLHATHQFTSEFLYQLVTQTTNDNQSLTEIVKHAQQNRTWLGGSVSSASLMQRLGWLNENREVVRNSSLDHELRSNLNTTPSGIRFQRP